MSAAFEELAGSPKISLDISSGQSSGWRQFKVAWNDVNQFLADIFGIWSISGGIASFAEATVPFPGISSLLASKCDIEPFLAEHDAPEFQTFDSISSATNVYPFTRITVSYKPQQTGQISAPNGTRIEISGDIGSEVMTIPGSKLKWKSTSTSGKPDLLPDSMNAGMPVGLNSFNVKWTRVPTPPFSTINQLAGRINQSDFAGYPKDCLVFDGAKFSSSFQIGGPSLWDLDYAFRARSVPWIQMYNQDESKFDDVIDANGSGKPLIQEGDFNTLFSF